MILKEEQIDLSSLKSIDKELEGTVNNIVCKTTNLHYINTSALEPCLVINYFRFLKSALSSQKIRHYLLNII